MKRFVIAGALASFAGCGGDPSTTTEGASTTGDTTGAASTTTGDDPPMTTQAATDTPTTADATTLAPTTGDATTDASTTEATDTGDSDASGNSTMEMPAGPMVDVSDPQLYEFQFKPDEADPEATEALATQLAALDTTVTPLGKLVVYLHGAGDQEVCGSGAHGRVLAKMGFHVVQPCYRSEYGVANCDDDIGGCRLEAFEGVDHHDYIDITPANSIETRVVKALEYLQAMHPGGDWQWFVVDGEPRWDHIVISGISHGASSSGVIAKVRPVDRAVMLSGPLDTGQAWLMWDSVTPSERYWAFTHTADDQHDGHLQSFIDIGMIGEPFVVDGAAPPYDGARRLVSSAPTDNGHVATQAGGPSPKDGDAYVFQPVWETMYLGE